ncbi:MAG: sulfur carrier protein ThiS adenylyltransferase ThiF [Kiritimatiellae bacterium]|nr:sulfur carrier protein ThiS adenylyltransferase ThiF [Kiritimatiellia bacterium]
MAANTYLTPEERTLLESVRVGIAGAGGLGSNCAMHLVRSGVKHITIADFDVVNESNLNRQFFFRDQLGQKKVVALKDNLLRIEPDADIRAVDIRLDASSAREIFADCGIVVEAFDAVDAKVMLVSAFASSGKKLVTASGLAGWGRSNAMKVRKMGNIVAIGDGETSVGDGAAPVSPRVGIAAAMQANSVVAMLLEKEL